LVKQLGHQCSLAGQSFFMVSPQPGWEDSAHPGFGGARRPCLGARRSDQSVPDALLLV